MATPRNEDPFDVEFGPSRVCPQCHIDKPLTPANWTGRYLDRSTEDYLGNIKRFQVRAPTVYCRACVNLNKRNNRLANKIIASAPDDTTRKEWEAMRMGKCSICSHGAKQRATLARFGQLFVVCSQCKAMILEAERTGDALAHARWQSSIMMRHCLDEVRIAYQIRTRTDLTHVPAHKFNPEAKYSTFSHLVCLSLELSWRKIRIWLETNVETETH